MSNMRYLWAAALIALCVGLCAGGALAADSWKVNATDQNIPAAAMRWDQGVTAAVTAQNDGTTTWGTNYSLTLIDPTDRWACPSDFPLPGPVQPGDADLAGKYTWNFNMVAPPITTLKYTLPITPTQVAVADLVSNEWALAIDKTPITGLATVGGQVAITRFPDDPASWAMFQIEECAGRVPVIVKGMTSGDYEPGTIVSRDQMAAFIRRALALPIHLNAGTFSDVAAGYWAGDDIQTLYDANIVKGQTATTYAPLAAVTRDQMAVFLARGLAGGDANVVTPASIHDFSDVPANYWASRYIQYCYANNVTKGATDTTFEPLTMVSRDQMAVFIYRSFIAPTPSVVVLAGPGVTSTVTDGQVGWPVAASGDPSAPGTAYVGFDAVRLGDSQVVTVKFQLMDGTTELASSGDLTLDAATVKAAAVASGVPYAYVTWDIPAGLTEGDYTLVTTVDGTVLDRKPAFSIAAAVAPPAPTVSVWHPASITAGSSAGPIVSGTAADLGAADGTYVVLGPATSGQVGTTGIAATGPIPTGVTVDNTAVMKLEIVFKSSVADPATIGPSLMTSGASGGSRYCDSPPSMPTTDTSYVWETANTAKIKDALTEDAPDFRMLECNTACTQPYTGPDYTFSMDMMEATFTSK